MPTSIRLYQDGLTLLEVIVGLAIAAVLLSIAVPSMQSLIGQSDMTATSNRLVYSLQTARSEAIKRSARVALCPSNNPLANYPACAGDYTRGWIVFVDDNGDGSRNGAEEILLQSKALSPQYKVTPDPVYENRVYFSNSGNSVNPVGIPLSGVIALDYQDGEELRVIAISTSGRIATTKLGGG